MVHVARFEKVSLRRFVTDWVATFPQQTVEQAVAAYERIRLPERRQAVPQATTSLRQSDLSLAQAKALRFRQVCAC